MQNYRVSNIFSSDYRKQLSTSMPRDMDEIHGAIWVESFLIDYFSINEEYQRVQQTIKAQYWRSEFKTKIMQRFIANKFSYLDVVDFHRDQFSLFLNKDDEELAKEALKNFPEIPIDLQQYLAWRLYSHKSDLHINNHLRSFDLFKLPKQYSQELIYKTCGVSDEKNTQSRGFDYSNIEKSIGEIVSEAQYCLKCHKRDKDTCRTAANGCPVDMPISQMIELFEDGHLLAALALAMKYHPMILATGDRICNDCMKSCIFQMQKPVDVPAIESKIVRMCTQLPWGFEILFMLMYWRPLNDSYISGTVVERGSVLVVGSGPAGFTAAYELLIRGYNVAVIDSLPGINSQKDEPTQAPVKSFTDMTRPLSQRTPGMFGGVMSYGITSRWDKNYLDAIKLILERHPRFKFVPFVKWGESFTKADAKAWGFDHIIMAIGASKPKHLSIPGQDHKHVLFANDFLITLHQGVAFNKQSPNKINIKSPLVVIGGGLTAIDTAVEAMAYLRNVVGEKDPKVKLIYRKNICNSPSYTQNFLEVQEAINNGVLIEDMASMVSIGADHIIYEKEGRHVNEPANSVVIAVGSEKSVDTSNSDSSYISYIGDMDPKYAGSVVKAIKSAKETVSNLQCNSHNNVDLHAFSQHFHASISCIKKIVADNNSKVEALEIWLHAPHQARKFQPGQYFRLTSLSIITKPIAISGIARDGDNICILIVGKYNSNSWCYDLKVGDSVGLLGPCGKKIEVYDAKKCLAIGESFQGVLLPIIKDMQNRDIIIDYLASGDLFFEHELKALCHNFSYNTHICPEKISFDAYDAIIIVGPPSFIENLSDYIDLNKDRIGDASIIVHIVKPMFCMMGGLCGRCVRYKDQKAIFSCEKTYKNIHK
jgi:NADPH-dependent glutamate synthase beta subunit-like oxidoreductase/NAD(P)H-flavin reductase